MQGERKNKNRLQKQIWPLEWLTRQCLIRHT